MDFHKQYRSMNENITPSDALVQQTIAQMESGRPHRARKPLKIILAVATALACVSTAVAANQEAVLRVLYQIAPGMAEYLQPVGQVCEDRGVKLEVVSADVEGSTAKVYLSLTDTTGSLFGDAAPDLYDSWHLDYPRWGRAAPLSCGCSIGATGVTVSSVSSSTISLSLVSSDISRMPCNFEMSIFITGFFRSKLSLYCSLTAFFIICSKSAESSGFLREDL